MAEKGNRTVALVELLTTKEKQVFGKQLEAGKRATLALLFHGILAGLKSSGSTSLEKELLYRSTFDEPYSKDKDYLLRNELRLLSKELVSFLSLEQIKKNFRDSSLEESCVFLQALLQRKQHTLFDKEWKKVVTEAEKELALNISLDVRKMAILSFIETRQATIENYDELLQLIADYQATLNTFFSHEHLFGHHRKAFAQRTQQALGKAVEIVPIDPIRIDLHNPASHDAFSNHLLALTDSYRLKGTDKIGMLEKAAGFISKIEAKKFDSKGALASINAGIALEYFLLQEFEASIPYHQNALEFGKKLDGAKLISFVFNYLSTLLRLEQHTEAIDLLEEYTSVWNKLPRMRDRFSCLKAMCHILEGDPSAAEKCIPEDRKAGGLDHYYYYRFVQIIILFQKGKPELAMNECENFEHTVRYNDKDEDYLKLIQVVKKFIAIKSEQSILSEEEFDSKAVKLSQLLEDTNQNSYADRALLYKWLKLELERKTPTNN